MPSASVPATAKQAHDTRDPRQWGWVEPTGWSERMLAALVNGVRGGKWPLAQCLLRCAGAFHHDRSPRPGAPIPMRKQPTGEPCAGDPLARFGGRGGESLPYPYCAGRRGLKVHPNCARRQKMSYLKGFRILITGSAASTQSARKIIAES